MWLSLLPLLALSSSVLVAATPELAAPHLKAGQAALASGQYLDASRAFTEALEHDKSYVTLYKRATAFLSMGRTGAALDDFDAILELNPSFAKANLEKAKVQVKEGSFAAARASLQAYLKSKPTDGIATDLLASVNAAETALATARKALKKHDYESCVVQATTVLDASPSLVEAREIRSDCFFGKGDIDDGIGELTRLAMLNPSSAPLSILVSTLSFFFVTPSQALPQLKQCLHYDPDSSSCKNAHRVLKGLAKSITQIDNFVAGSAWRSAVNHLVGTPSKPSVIEAFDETLASYRLSFPAALSTPAALRLSEPRRKLYSAACKALTELGETSKAQPYCDETLLMKADDVDGLVGRAESLMKAEDWEAAVRALDQAFEATGRSSQDVMNRLQKAQRLLKQSKAKDYYKVIGVSRDADARTIKRAYRKAAKTAHPDKGGSEAKMAALNEAYEVLSNPELKARFDNGDDPNDTASQGHGGHGGNPFAHHGGNPFGQFFQQQGGGGFHHQGGFRQSHQEFKFNFQ